MNEDILPGRFLIGFDTHHLTHILADVAVIGSGVAGLRAAIEASRFGDVLLMTKGRLSDGSTSRAQGGIAAVMGLDDHFQNHIEDTLATGHGLCDPETVRVVIEEGPDLIREMIQWGAAFDLTNGELQFAREGGHSAARVVHAHGDSTGFEVSRCLIEKLESLSNVRAIEHSFIIDLLTWEGQCLGFLALSRREGFHCVWAKQVILATGGCGQVYRETTNPPVVTGDGLACAYRAGAVLQDMEFVQFHPTTLYVAGSARSLISEAVRGEGGVLINGRGERFMPKYHEKADLAPRDIVSQSILKEIQASGDTNVFLDVRHIPKSDFQERFPSISNLCEQFEIDVATDPIPVRPSQHYMVGGIRTDLHGRTSLPNLYACGEAVSSGLHGANRLASNSLLEGLVFGYRCGENAGKAAAQSSDPLAVRRFRYDPVTADYPTVDIWDLRNSLKSEMSRVVAVERDEAHLTGLLDRMHHWMRYALRTEFDWPDGWETQNILTVAWLITYSALQRQESRGVHFRTDFPERNDQEWLRHTVLQSQKGTEDV